MSFKENIDAIKEELTAEEKFLESVIKSESFFKKNKKVIISVSVAVLLGVFGSIGFNYMKEKNLEESNKIFLELISKPNDKNLEDKLKSKNIKLYELYKTQLALNSSDEKVVKEVEAFVSDPILKDLIDYQTATLVGSDLLKYAGNGEAIMKELAYLEAGYKALESGDRQKAEDILGFISPTSSLYQLVQTLKHYNK